MDAARLTLFRLLDGLTICLPLKMEELAAHGIKQGADQGSRSAGRRTDPPLGPESEKLASELGQLGQSLGA
jgi:hypothetical protein